MKLTKNAGSYKIIIPKAIIEKVLKWEDGEELDISVGSDTIYIKRKEV